MQTIKLLFNGEEAFKRIIEHIQQAKETIFINMFIWRDDRIGNIIAGELFDAAERGVQITIIKDKLGELFEKGEENKQSFFHKRYNLLSSMKARVLDSMYPFLGKPKGYKQKINPLAYKLTNHPNVYIYKEEIRNDHSKYYIFDNQVLIIGGINIEDKEIYTDVSGVKYCDYMVEMNGDEYIKEFNSQLNEGRFYKNEPTIEFIYNIKRNNTKVFKAKTEILKLINSATSSIDLVMAYFGDRDINNAIIEKANQGVKVTIITAQKANIQNDLNRKVLKELMKKTNNKINLYLSRRMVHAKLIQVDGKVMTVGSINLNRAALIKMYETNVLVKNYQPEFNEKLQESIRKSISESVKISDHNQITYKRVKAFLESIV